MEDQIFTPQETPTLDDVMNTEQEDVVYEPLDNVIDDEIHTQTEPSDVQIPESEEIETGEPIEVTIEDQIITPKKNRIDFQGYELDNISEADNGNDVPSIKQVRDIVEEVESEKQDKLTAGDNITITDNVIAATDTTYTAGSGLTLTDTEFSVGTITTSMIDNNAVTDGKIASNAINNSEIKDNQITPSKLNWSEFGNQTVSIAKNDVADGGQFGKITVTKAGTYFIIASGYMNYAGSSSIYPGVSLYVNSNRVTSALVGPTTAAQINPTVTSVQQLSVGDEVILVGRNATLSCWQGSMTIIRIN